MYLYHKIQFKWTNNQESKLRLSKYVKSKAVLDYLGLNIVRFLIL